MHRLFHCTALLGDYKDPLYIFFMYVCTYHMMTSYIKETRMLVKNLPTKLARYETWAFTERSWDPSTQHKQCCC